MSLCLRIKCGKHAIFIILKFKLGPEAWKAGVQTLKIYLLNLLNEPQHLAEIKAPKLLKTSKQRVTNLRERKLKNDWLKLHEKKLNERRKSQGSLTWLGSLPGAQLVNTKRIRRRERKRNSIVTWNKEKKKDIFYSLGSLLLYCWKNVFRSWLWLKDLISPVYQQISFRKTYVSYLWE